MNKIKSLFVLVVWLISWCGEASPTIDDFFSRPGLISMTISPNGRYIARLIDKNNLRVVTIADLASVGELVVGIYVHMTYRPTAIKWANDERLLVGVGVPDQSYINRHAKDKGFDIDDYYIMSKMISIDVNVKNVVVLMDHEIYTVQEAGLSSFTGILENDPSHILMNAIKNNRRVLYRVNIYTGESELLSYGSQYTIGFLSANNGGQLYRIDYRKIAKKLKIFERINSDWQEIDTVDFSEDFDMKLEDYFVVLNDDLIYRKLNVNSGFNELVRYDRKNKTREVIASEQNADILYPLLNINKSELIGHAVDGNNVRFKYYNSSAQESYNRLSSLLGASDFRYASTTADGKKSIIIFSAPDNPGAFALYDASTNQLSHLEFGWKNLHPSKLSVAAKTTYMTRDNVSINAYLLLPEGYKEGRKYPLIVMPHGGPQERDRSNYDDFAQFLSTRGYIVIKPNFRGSTGRGKAFQELGYKQWGQLMQNDLTDAVEFMVKKGFVDSGKVCIAGISYGGYAALMGAIKTPDVFKCAMSINGVTHLSDLIAYKSTLLENPELIDRFLYQRIGDPKKDIEMLDEYSPVLHASKVSTPLLLIASEKDESVPFEQTSNFAATLKKHKKDFNFIKLKHSSHNPFQFREESRTVFEEADIFFRKHLQQ